MADALALAEAVPVAVDGAAAFPVTVLGWFWEACEEGREYGSLMTSGPAADGGVCFLRICCSFGASRVAKSGTDRVVVGTLAGAAWFTAHPRPRRASMPSLLKRP